jgi:hypothetical protein
MTAFRPRHLSVSAVQLYVKCPALYQARYVKKRVSPTNQFNAFGKAFHMALEAEHRGKDSERALVAAWNQYQEILNYTNAGVMPSKIHALKLLDIYRDRGLGGQMGQPERRFSLMLPTANVPVPVVGYIDLPIPERRRFREFKTTLAKTWTATRIALEHQLHVYGWAYQRAYHHRAECAEYVIFRTDTPQVDVFEAVPSPDGLRLFETVAEAVWHGIVNEKYDGCGACELCKPPVARPDNGPVVTFDV